MSEKLYYNYDYNNMDYNKQQEIMSWKNSLIVMKN